MSQAHGAALWQEPVDAGATPAIVQQVLVQVAGAWEHGTSAQEGAALDPGDGSRTIFSEAAEHFAVAVSGGFEISPTGPAAAVLTDDGAGGLALTAVGAGVVPAGRFLPDSRGDVHPIRLDTPDLRFALIRGDIQSY